MVWADWVEKRTEWGSTYGAGWSAVESDEPMAAVLTELQAEFFSEPHPIKKILRTEKKILRRPNQANQPNASSSPRAGG